MTAVIAQDLARFTSFYISLAALEVPEGSMMTTILGHDVPYSHNVAIREFLAYPQLEWLLIMGDDHEFEKDYLLRLLAHDVDICVGFCLTRMPPYAPIAFTGFLEWPRRERINLNEHESGLVQVHSVGTGGMLIRRRVIETLTDPWFQYGKSGPEETTEDLYFCDKAREAGFGIHVDLDNPLGHLTTGAVYPVRTEEGWTFRFAMSGGLQIVMPHRLGP